MTQKNTELNQDITLKAGVVMMPHIEENIPVPKNSQQALPTMTNEEEVMVRAHTIKEITDLTGEEIAPNANHVQKATHMATEMIENPEKRQEFAIQPSPTIAVLGGIVGSMNHMIVKDLADLKLYVVNRLVGIVENEESNHKEQITALRSIGEVDGVDAFKKKVETTAKEQSIDEVERELLKLLTEFKVNGTLKPKSQTIDADYTMSKKEVDELQEEVKEHVGEYEVKEQSFDDIVQEATDGNTSGE
jgi:hypothetical protein